MKRDAKAVIRWCEQSCWNFVTAPSFATEDGQFEIPYGILMLSVQDA